MRGTVSTGMLSTIDLTYENQLIKSDFMEEFNKLYDSNMLMVGPSLDELEKGIAAYCGTRHCALLGSGTMAIHVAAKALGIGPGDEVIVPANTFLATAVGFYHAGAKIVLADVNPETFNLTPETVRRVITPRTKAICLVHLYGGIVDPEEFREFQITLVEDASHAFGGELRGKRVGNLADMGVFSAGPIKGFGALGHAGFMTYNQNEFKYYINAFINNGQTRRHYAEYVGHNFRMDSLNALFLLRKLDCWPKVLNRRRQAAAIYDEELSRHGIRFQKKIPGSEPSLWVYVIRLDASIRDKVMADLKDANVHCLVQYTCTINQMPIWKEIGAKKANVPVSEQLCREVISLPVHAGIAADDAMYICSKLIESVERHRG